MNYFNLGNKIENLSDKNPTFIGTAYKFTYLLTYTQIKVKGIHESTQEAQQMAGWKLKDQQFFYTGI